MILNIAIPIAIILIILAIIITSMVVNTIRALQNKDIESQMDAVSSQVTQYFDPFFVSGQFISDRPSVRQIMAQMEQSPATYRFEMVAALPAGVARFAICRHGRRGNRAGRLGWPG